MTKSGRSVARHISLILAATGAGLALIAFLPADATLRSLHVDPATELARHAWREAFTKLRILVLLLAAAAIAVLVPPVRGRIDDFQRALADSALRLRADLVRGWSTVSSREWLFLVVFMGIGALLRIRFLGRPLLWDEGTTFFEYANRGMLTSLAWYPKPNNHVLNSLLAALSMSAFGPALAAFRLPVLLAGLLQIPATWLLTRSVFGSAAATLAAGLVATSSVLVGFSVNGRGYAMAGLMLVLLMTVAVRLRKRDETSLWAAFAILTGLGLFAVPVMLYAVAFVTLWMFASSAVRDFCMRPGALARRVLTTAVATAGMTLCLYMPVLLVSGPARLFANRFVLPITWSAFIASWPAVLADTGAQWVANVPGPLVLLFLLALVPAIAGWPKSTAKVRVPIAIGFLGCIMLTVVLRVVPQPRIWSILVPVFLTCVAGGLVSWAMAAAERIGVLKRPRLAGLAVALLIGILGFRTATASMLISRSIEIESLPVTPEFSQFLSRELREGDAVVSGFPSDHVVKYELMRAGLERYLHTPPDQIRRVIVVVNRSWGPQQAERVLMDSPYADRVSGPGASLLQREGFEIRSFDVKPGPGGQGIPGGPGTAAR